MGRRLPARLLRWCRGRWALLVVCGLPPEPTPRGVSGPVGAWVLPADNGAGPRCSWFFPVLGSRCVTCSSPSVRARRRRRSWRAPHQPTRCAVPARCRGTHRRAWLLRASALTSLFGSALILSGWCRSSRNARRAAAGSGSFHLSYADLRSLRPAGVRAGPEDLDSLADLAQCCCPLAARIAEARCRDRSSACPLVPPPGGGRRWVSCARCRVHRGGLAFNPLRSSCRRDPADASRRIDESC